MGEKTCRILGLLTPLLAFFTCITTCYADDVGPIVQGIHDRYKADKGLAITYRREVRTRTMSMLGNQVKGDIASGMIYILPPDLLKVEQETPRKETLLTDGKSLWWVIPEERKVYQYPSDQFGQELRILTDLWKAPARLKGQFLITLKTLDKSKSWLLEMIPSPPWKNIDRIRIQVSKDYELKVLEIVNSFGTTTRFYLDHIVPAKGLTRKSFNFEVPDGFTVVKGQ